MRVIETIIHTRKDPVSTVDEFWYGVPKSPTGTGVRDLSRRMKAEGKIISRFVALNEEGTSLILQTIFASEAAYDEWCADPVRNDAREKWRTEKLDTGEWECIKNVSKVLDMVVI